MNGGGRGEGMEGNDFRHTNPEMLPAPLHRLAVPSVKLSIGSRSFSVSGPTVWNALPDYLRNPTLPTDVFTSHLKPFLFAHY